MCVCLGDMLSRLKKDMLRKFRIAFMLFENRVYAFNHINEKQTDGDKFQLWFYFIKHNKKSLCKNNRLI